LSKVVEESIHTSATAGRGPDLCAWPCESTHLWPAKVRTLERLT
jgi:hypothetical protein